MITLQRITESSEIAESEPRTGIGGFAELLFEPAGVESGELISLTEVYAEYKKFAKQNPNQTVADELGSITRYAPVYRELIDPEVGSSLSKLSHRLAAFDMSTAYPLILRIAISSAPIETKMLLYELIGSFVIRRALCGLTAKNYNLAFIEFTSEMRSKGVSVESFAAVAQLRKDSESAKFPSDSELKAAITNRNQYQTLPGHRLRLIIEELEMASRDKFSATSDVRKDLSVEHIMPQQWRKEWPLPSGEIAPPPGGLVKRGDDGGRNIGQRQLNSYTRQFDSLDEAREFFRWPIKFRLKEDAPEGFIASDEHRDREKAKITRLK